MRISDIEEYMKGGQLGGVVVGKRKFMALAYADGLALVAERKRKWGQCWEGLKRTWKGKDWKSKKRYKEKRESGDAERMKVHI